jgi:hypothetical protein
MTSRGGRASPGDHGFYRDAARCEFESVADLDSATLEYEMVCWLVALELQAFEEMLTRLSEVPAKVQNVTVVVLPQGHGEDSVEIEIRFAR